MAQEGGRGVCPVSALACGLLASLWLAPALAQSGLDPAEVELEDVVEIEILGRDVFAYDLLGSGAPSVRLGVAEELLWEMSQGRIAMVLTSERVLAVSPGIGNWQEVRYQVHEVPPERALMGKRVALVVTGKRVLGFDGDRGVWIEQVIGPQERIDAARVGAGTAVVVTDRRVYGLSPNHGGFFKEQIGVHERLKGVRVSANMATVRTSERVLVFRAPSGVWTSRRRSLD